MGRCPLGEARDRIVAAQSTSEIQDWKLIIGPAPSNVPNPPLSMPVGNGCVQNAREHFTGFRVDWSRKEPLVCITLEDWQEAPEILFQRGFHIVCPVSAWRQPRWLCKALAQCCSFLWGCFLVTTHERRLLNLPCAHWPHFQRPYSTLKTQRTLRSQQGQCCPVFLSVALSGERTWDAVGANIWGGGLTTQTLSFESFQKAGPYPAHCFMPTSGSQMISSCV